MASDQKIKCFEDGMNPTKKMRACLGHTKEGRPGGADQCCGRETQLRRPCASGPAMWRFLEEDNAGGQFN